MTESPDAPTVCVVVPCYNEEEVLAEASVRLRNVLDSLAEEGLASPQSHILFVDDGSADTTWALIEQEAAGSSRICGLKLSRNRGHQNAVFAGLMEGVGDVFISIDADLQDDVEAIAEMVRRHVIDGAEIVYGVRSSRESDTVFKRLTAEFYYKLLEAMGVEVVFNHADFRLMSARAVRALGSYREVQLFLRGLVPLIGFKSDTVEYERCERFAGESKYPLAKMLSLAWEGVTSFSARPLRMISFAGLVVSGSAFVFAAAAIIASLSGATVAGWTSLIVAITFLGGIQLLAIGLIGEYVGKIFSEVKDRPRYFVDRKAGEIDE